MISATEALMVLAAYLLGSISFSYWTVRRTLGQDVRRLGSGNAGATNVLRVAGTAPALVVFGGDVGKGVLAVLVARALGASTLALGAVTVAVVVGHVFPIYHRFRGGKGVATAAGAVGALMPWAMLAAVAVFALVVVTTRHVALGSMSAVASCPVFAMVFPRLGWTTPASGWFVAATTAVAMLIIWLHRTNIQRIRSGTEWRLGDPR